MATSHTIDYEARGSENLNIKYFQNQITGPEVTTTLLDE